MFKFFPNPLLLLTWSKTWVGGGEVITQALIKWTVVYVAVNFFSSVNFCFSFVLNSLAYIKSLKSWLIWTVCAIFSSLYEIKKQIAAIKTCKIAGQQKRLFGWFSNRTGTSVDDCARKSNNWLDQRQRGKFGTGSPVKSFPRDFPSSIDFPVLSLNQPFKRELKQRRFWATHVNRKWNFCTLELWFWAYSWANRLSKGKDTYNTDLVASRYMKKKNAHFRWRASLKNVAV